MQKKIDQKKPRTENGVHFATEFSDELFLKAVKKCMDEATCTGAQVAEIIGCNPTVATRRLLKLVEGGKLTNVRRGRSWGFRPKQENEDLTL
jgi:hypothetical protein